MNHINLDEISTELEGISHSFSKVAGLTGSVFNTISLINQTDKYKCYTEKELPFGIFIHYNSCENKSKTFFICQKEKTMGIFMQIYLAGGMHYLGKYF